MAFLLLSSLLFPVQAISEQCEESLVWYVTGFFSVLPTSSYEQMAFFSGRRLNDLGSYDECNSLNNAHYALLRPYGLTNLAIGLCIPKDCGKEDLYDLIHSDDNQKFGILSNIK